MTITLSRHMARLVGATDEVLQFFDVMKLWPLSPELFTKNFPAFTNLDGGADVLQITETDGKVTIEVKWYDAPHQQTVYTGPLDPDTVADASPDEAHYFMTCDYGDGETSESSYNAHMNCIHHVTSSYNEDPIRVEIEDGRYIITEPADEIEYRILYNKKGLPQLMLTYDLIADTTTVKKSWIYRHSIVSHSVEVLCHDNTSVAQCTWNNDGAIIGTTVNHKSLGNRLAKLPSWPNGPELPVEAYAIGKGTEPTSEPYLYECDKDGKPISVTMRSIFGDKQTLYFK